MRADLKKDLQERWILPPDKPRLNRKRFIEEAEKEWNERPKSGIWEYFLIQAFQYMLNSTEGQSTRASPEAVGAAKVLKLAIRLRQFSEEFIARGEQEYKLADQYNYIKDILDA